MKVNQTQVQGVLGAYGRQQVNKPKQADVKAAVKAAAPAPAHKPSDAVELSPEARELAAVKQRLAEVPDVREQRVAELTARVQSGAYQVPARDVAKRILDLGL